LDPDLGEAEASLGLLASSEWRWEEAERRYRRGLELSPGYVVGLHWYGNYLSMTGRHDEAVATLRQALSLDPLSLPIQMALATTFFFGGRLEEAVAVCQKAIELDPAFAPAYFNLTNFVMQKMRYDEALRVMTEFSRVAPAQMPPGTVEELRVGYADGGARGLWEAALRSTSARMQDLGPIAYFDMATACAQLGRVDEAFGHLERLVASRDPRAPQVAWDPSLTPLHSDPRFAEIKRKFGLSGSRRG
jgi:tetratricopeptide (TPR) repeat protein